MFLFQIQFCYTVIHFVSGLLLARFMALIKTLTKNPCKKMSVGGGGTSGNN